MKHYLIITLVLFSISILAKENSDYSLLNNSSLTTDQKEFTDDESLSVEIIKKELKKNNKFQDILKSFKSKFTSAFELVLIKNIGGTTYYSLTGSKTYLVVYTGTRFLNSFGSIQSSLLVRVNLNYNKNGSFSGSDVKVLN